MQTDPLSLFSVQFLAIGEGNSGIDLINGNISDNFGGPLAINNVTDNVQIAVAMGTNVVPEPPVLALIGALAMGWGKRRKIS